MKKILSLCIIIVPIVFASSFNIKDVIGTKVTTSKITEESWYICIDCCKTKKGTNLHSEQGCKKAPSHSHTYWRVGKAGDRSYECSNCGAEVFMAPSSTPYANSKCCGGGSHKWFHRN